MKLAVLPLTTVAALGAGPGSASVTKTKQTCEDAPCANGGTCIPSDNYNRGFFCRCADDWTGIFCTVEPPKVVCGDSFMQVNVKKDLVLEHDLDDSVEHIGFRGKGTGCTVTEDGDEYTLRINSPFSQCGTVTKHEGGDYEYTNAVVYRQKRKGLPTEEAVEMTFDIVEFKCTYEDEYTVHSDALTPAVTTVDHKTDLGDFTVEMALFKDEGFMEPYPEDPVIAKKSDVCVKLSLTNTIRDDLVLTANKCAAYSNMDGTGLQNTLISDRCSKVDDVTVQLIQNGLSNDVNFCFQMYQWTEKMDQVYISCEVEVCQKAGPGIANQCVCMANDINYDDYYYVNYYYINYIDELYNDQYDNAGRKRRAAEETEGAAEAPKGMYKPENAWNATMSLKVVDEMSPEELKKRAEVMREGQFNVISEEILRAEIEEIAQDNNQIVMMITIALVVAVIALGICVGVYVQCNRRYNQQRHKIREMRKVKEFYNGVLKPYNHPTQLPSQTPAESQ